MSVNLIVKQTSKLPAKIFKAIPYIPDIARLRKKAIDQVLVSYKKGVNDNLRYVIKNDEDDIKLLVRSYDEYDHQPYREMALDQLGKLPDFQCVTKKDAIPEAFSEEIKDTEHFQITCEEKKRKKRRSPQKASRDTINDRITCFLNGFDVDLEESSEKGDIIPDLKEPTQDVPETTSVETNV